MNLKLLSDDDLAAALREAAGRIKDQADTIKWLQARLQIETELREAGNVLVRSSDQGPTIRRDDPPRYRGDGTLDHETRLNVMDSPIVKAFIERANTILDEQTVQAMTTAPRQRTCGERGYDNDGGTGDCAECDDGRCRYKPGMACHDPILTDEELAANFLAEKQAHLERTRLLNERMAKDLKDE
jgi:hypothetical protein